MLLARLEGAGVTLAGFELGNEINSPMFNEDFSLPAENPSRSREFNLDDLSHDPEAQQVARGYLLYLKLLAVIKDVRSRSKLNQHAAIVSAGLVFNEAVRRMVGAFHKRAREVYGPPVVTDAPPETVKS